MQLPPAKQSLLNHIVELLSPIQGVQAVVLGGSYARGTQHEGSDLDIGIYYHEEHPFDIEDIRRAAAEFSAQGVPDVTDFYGWGPWVNGGGWIHTPVCKVDFLYRNLEQVQSAIRDAHAGILHHDYNQQPAFGFYGVIYLAETRVCVPLFDPEGCIARLKEQVAVYPPLLKEKTVSSSLWLAEFSLIHAAGYAAKSDVYATVGALARSASFLTQVLFALNETYFMTDKTALKEISAFAIVPPDYASRLSAILANPGLTAAELTQAVKSLTELWSDVVALTGGQYKPAFQL